MGATTTVQKYEKQSPTILYLYQTRQYFKRLHSKVNKEFLFNLLVTKPLKMGEKETDQITRSDYDDKLKELQIFDCNRYGQRQLLQNIEVFFKRNSVNITDGLLEQIKNLKEGKYLQSHKYPLGYQISNKYLHSLHQYLRRRQAQKKVKFRKVNQEHKEFLQSIMMNQNTRDLSLDKKLLLFKQQFPNCNISRGTLYRIQRNYLGYSFKKVSQYIPKPQPNIDLKKIFFIQKFIEALKDKKTIVFVIDEAGLRFGTSPLRRYSYSLIGQPAIIQKQRLLSKNLTCTACISEKCCEFINFFYGGGTKTKMFENYMNELVTQMKKKYPQNNLMFVMDNLASHKYYQVFKAFQDDYTSMLFTPATTPQFSPIENMFGDVKKTLKDYSFQNKEETAEKIAEIMFNLEEKSMQVFFRFTFQLMQLFSRKSLNNMRDYWEKLDHQKIEQQIQELQN